MAQKLKRERARLVVALSVAVSGASSANAQIIPTFDPPQTYSTVFTPQSIAATPDDYDLVGAISSITPNTPDGYPEIAIGSLETGFVRIYRNDSEPLTPPALSLQLLLEIDVFNQIDELGTMTGMQLREIKFERMNDLDTDPDLIVAVSYEDDQDPTIKRGLVANFQADRTAGAITGFSLRNTVLIAYPVTGLAIADYSTDGRPDVIATCEQSGESGSNPSRLFIIENIFEAGTVNDYGKLSYIADVTTPTGSQATYNIVAGQFSNLLTFGNGNKLDFVSFGTASTGIKVGIGNGIGPFTFTVNPVAGAACGTITHGFGSGSGIQEHATAAMVAFDPFSSIKKSLATNSSPSHVTLIHYDPRFGSFSHLCSGDSSLDTYDMLPRDSACVEIAQLQGITSYVASGKLNPDAHEDLAFISSSAEIGAVLLGRGTPGSDGRIMDFSNCRINGEYPYYPFDFYADGENSQGNGLDRIMCVDLNRDGCDDVIITPTTVVGSSRFVVYPNTTCDDK